MANQGTRTNEQGQGMARGLEQALRARYRAGQSAMGILVLCLSFCMIAQAAKKYPLTTAPIVPGARAEAVVSRDKNGNTKVKIKVKFLAPPSNLTPAKNSYVVWFTERDASPEIQGVLKVDKNREATFETTTPFKSFAILITAEDDSSPKAPTGPEVLKATVQP